MIHRPRLLRLSRLCSGRLIRKNFPRPVKHRPTRGLTLELLEPRQLLTTVGYWPLDQGLASQVNSPALDAHDSGDLPVVIGPEGIGRSIIDPVEEKEKEKGEERKGRREGEKDEEKKEIEKREK